MRIGCCYRLRTNKKQKVRQFDIKARHAGAAGWIGNEAWLRKGAFHLKTPHEPYNQASTSRR
ncbi:hypothetical protein MIZ03_0257 [Rhodoferax lithotrophicus]|uniref:Uncharacterized protein n=1 Tax=Rhodoferax lithotrophicus TaxID=2798804 RepID=A0ABM7MGR4_9BURK|nr:hypothetical protein MIZ03_0257 [Rhodoferax sp. MIZ03]